MERSLSLVWNQAKVVTSSQDDFTSSALGAVLGSPTTMPLHRPRTTPNFNLERRFVSEAFVQRHVSWNVIFTVDGRVIAVPLYRLRSSPVINNCTQYSDPSTPWNYDKYS